MKNTLQVKHIVIIVNHVVRINVYETLTVLYMKLATLDVISMFVF